MVDWANGFFGRALTVEARASKRQASRAEVAEDTASLMVEYEGGVLASFFLSFTAGSAYRGPDVEFACGTRR